MHAASTQRSRAGGAVHTHAMQREAEGESNGEADVEAEAGTIPVAATTRHMTDAPHDNLGAAQQLYRRARPEKVVELEPAKTRATSDTQSACSSVMAIVTSGTGAA
jgi:hypothetical protein